MSNKVGQLRLVPVHVKILARVPRHAVEGSAACFPRNIYALDAVTNIPVDGHRLLHPHHCQKRQHQILFQTPQGRQKIQAMVEI
ncbi:hypothetical protein MAR_018245 [Mya arenaria]|uniref:Uncharacterized protein n=1 Tax=Mya arenaria TaxID=6604 RepID=A0ABY7EE36_MYAAR|nr:hypothetical protein MAR_018245 [Mya arenaria]